MKKIKITVSMLLMVAILCSCSKGGSSATVSDTQNSGSVNNSSKANEITSTSNTMTKSDLPYIYEDPGKAIVFNYNKDVQVIEKGYARDFESAGDYSIVFNRSSRFYV